MIISPDTIRSYLLYRDFFMEKAEQLYKFLVKYKYPNLKADLFSDIYFTESHYVFCYTNDWDLEFSQEIEIPRHIIDDSDLNLSECPLIASFCTKLNQDIIDTKEKIKSERKLKQYQKLKAELKL